MRVYAVIVTYNRLYCLKKCVEAVSKQSVKPNRIYIIDNASTDDTSEYLAKLQNEREDIMYIRLESNTGGAGGFYTGIRAAHLDGDYDAIWVMDDDGIPDVHCLENLIKHISDYSFLSPLVINIDNHDEVSFNTLKNNNVNDIKSGYPNGIIKGHANPFNGVLFRKDLIEKVGFPKKEMFIWGDENEYEARIRYNGFEYATIINAVHYHPKDRLVLFRDCLGRKKIIYVESKLRRYCKYRNTAYVLRTYKGVPNIISYIIRYTIFYLINRKADFGGLFFYYSAVLDGLKKDFSKHKKYIGC